MKINSVNDVKSTQLIAMDDPLGKLVVAESGTNLPIDIKRVFFVYGPKDARRGRHAHKELTQILIAINGSCDVICDDGKETKSFRLNSPDSALIIPPGIWAEQHYLHTDTILTVLCDKIYTENDYIRDYEQFIKYRNGVN